MKERLPAEAEDLLLTRQVNHSALALAELVHTIGRLDPSHPETGRVVKMVRKIVDKVPAHRVHAPSTQAMLDAGVLTGVAARLLGLSSADKQPLFNDAVLLFQALEQGYCLLSRNVADFDRFLQLLPNGRVLLYRQRVLAGRGDGSP